MKPVVLGIAGKTGAGKNRVAELLEERGWRTLDLDLVAHQALAVLGKTIDEALGPGLLLEDETIDRKELGRRAFSDPEALAVLEGITYPWIEVETRRWIGESEGCSSAIHAINLHKTSLTGECDGIIWVNAPRRLRRRRVMARDGKSWKELKGRFRSQKGLNSKLFSQNAEIYSVRNAGNDRSLREQLDRVLSRFL